MPFCLAQWAAPNGMTRMQRTAPSGACSVCARDWACLPTCGPIKLHPALIDASPLKPDRLQGVDILVLRELTGGLYFGQPKSARCGMGTSARWIRLNIMILRSSASWTWLSTWQKVEKRRSLPWIRPMCWKPPALWRQIAGQVGKEHPEITLEHQLVDSAAMKLITAPAFVRRHGDREHLWRHPDR